MTRWEWSILKVLNYFDNYTVATKLSLQNMGNKHYWAVEHCSINYSFYFFYSIFLSSKIKAFLAHINEFCRKNNAVKCGDEEQN